MYWRRDMDWFAMHVKVWWLVYPVYIIGGWDFTVA